MSLGYIVRRLLGALPLLFGISLILFTIVHLAPGGPLDVYVDNPSVSKEALDQIAKAYGLDQPVPVQYVLWLKSMVVGDWGYSIRTGRPVLAEIVLRLGPTLELGGLALLISLLLAIPLGIISASRRGSKLDGTLTLVSFAGISTPVFWLALLLQLLFSVQLGWLPSAGYKSIGDGSFMDRVAHIVMPAAVLSLATIASWSRFIRSGMVDVLNQDYIRTAYAKGLGTSHVIIGHALRNALLPVVTMVGLQIAELFGGAVLTETIFSLPGVGRLAYDSVFERDYPLILGVLLVCSFVIILVNLIIDLIYTLLDPRVEVSR